VQCAFGQRQIPFVVVDLLRRYSNDPEGLARLVKLVVREESIRKLAGRRVRPDWQCAASPGIGKLRGWSYIVRETRKNRDYGQDTTPVYEP